MLAEHTISARGEIDKSCSKHMRGVSMRAGARGAALAPLCREPVTGRHCPHVPCVTCLSGARGLMNTLRMTDSNSANSSRRRASLTALVKFPTNTREGRAAAAGVLEAVCESMCGSGVAAARRKASRRTRRLRAAAQTRCRGRSELRRAGRASARHHETPRLTRLTRLDAPATPRERGERRIGKRHTSRRLAQGVAPDGGRCS